MTEVSSHSSRACRRKIPSAAVRPAGVRWRSRPSAWATSPSATSLRNISLAAWVVTPMFRAIWAAVTRPNRRVRRGRAARAGIAGQRPTGPADRGVEASRSGYGTCPRPERASRAHDGDGQSRPATPGAGSGRGRPARIAVGRAPRGRQDERRGHGRCEGREGRHRRDRSRGRDGEEEDEGEDLEDEQEWSRPRPSSQVAANRPQPVISPTIQLSPSAIGSQPTAPRTSRPRGPPETWSVRARPRSAAARRRSGAATARLRGRADDWISARRSLARPRRAAVAPGDRPVAGPPSSAIRLRPGRPSIPTRRRSCGSGRPDACRVRSARSHGRRSFRGCVGRPPGRLGTAAPRSRRARAWYSGPCLRGSAYSFGFIVQYVPLVVPYQLAPPQSGSNGSHRPRRRRSNQRRLVRGRRARGRHRWRGLRRPGSSRGIAPSSGTARPAAIPCPGSVDGRPAPLGPGALAPRSCRLPARPGVPERAAVGPPRGVAARPVPR